MTLLVEFEGLNLPHLSWKFTLTFLLHLVSENCKTILVRFLHVGVFALILASVLGTHGHALRKRFCVVAPALCRGGDSLCGWSQPFASGQTWDVTWELFTNEAAPFR